MARGGSATLTGRVFALPCDKVDPTIAAISTLLISVSIVRLTACLMSSSKGERRQPPAGSKSRMWRGLAQPRTEGAAGGTETAGRIGILCTVLLWGSQIPLAHELAQRWDPFTISALRYPVGAAVLLAFAGWRGDFRARPAAEPPGLGRKAALGAAMAGFGTLFTVGLAIGDPVACAVVAAMAPLMAMLVAWLAERQVPQRSLILPVAFVVPGALLASLQLSGAAAEGPAGAGALAGPGLMLVAQACWSWYSVKAQRWLSGCSQVEISGRSLAYCCPFLFAAWGVAALAGATYADWQTSPERDAVLFTMLTFGAMVLGILMWNVAVARIGLPVAALHLNLIPVVAIGVALGLGITPRPEQIAGAGLVLAGVLAAQRPWTKMRRRRS